MGTQKRILILRVGSFSFFFLKCFSTPCITNQSISLSLSLSLRTQNQNFSTSSLSRRVQLCARPKLSLTPSFVNPSDSRTRRPPPWLGFERCLCCSRRSRWRTASSRRPILGCPPCCSCWRCLLLLFNNNNNSVCCVIKERKVFGQFLVSVVFFLLVLLFCLFCLSQKFPSLFFVFFALLFETNSFQPARTSTKEIHKFIFLGLFRDLEQPKPVSFCLSLPLSSKEGRRSAFTTSLTPSPPLPSLFSHQF